MFCREREVLVFHRHVQPSERGNNPFMYFSCSLTTPVGVLFVLSSSVCLIFPSLSSVFYLLCLQQTLGSFFFSLPKLLTTTLEIPVWVVCLSFVGLCLCICLIPQSKERKKETGVVKRKKNEKMDKESLEWLTVKATNVFHTFCFPLHQNPAIIIQKKKRKYTGILNDKWCTCWCLCICVFQDRVCCWEDANQLVCFPAS